MAHASGSGNVWSGIDIKGNAKVQLGNSYHYGSSQDEKILSAIFESLHYPEMGQRGREVPDAGHQTFEWLFEETGQETSSVHEFDEYSNESDDYSAHVFSERSCEAEQLERSACAEKLRTWLKADDSNNIFWVTGKPGSGKSTFIKFLRDHDQTDALLKEWVGERKLIVADHFFWLPGRPIQSSAEGLLRTLLHTALVDIASVDTTMQSVLARSICSKRRWSLQGSHRPWPLRELKQSLERVSTIPGTRIFLLIDGLDECCPQHSHDDFMDTLLNILQLPNFKSCVSSRPWLEFAARLSCAPSLCLDRLTRFDMMIVLTNRIMHAARDRTQYLNPPHHDIDELADFVVNKAQGVFLWLELVTRALAVEIKKDRDLRRLYQITESLPSDLEQYFMELICQRIDRSNGNVSDTASALKLASMLHDTNRADQEPFEDRYTFIDFWLLSRGALTALMTFPEASTARFCARQIAIMLHQTRSFLEQSCKDLLIVVGSRNDSDDMRVSCSLEHSVQYLHRSAYDFLTTGPLKQSIEQASPPHFKEEGFLPRLTAIRAAYRLLEVGADCSAAREALYDAVLNQTAFPPEDRTRFLRTCEAFAVTHISVSCSCFGREHGRLLFVRPALSDLSTPYNYMRALLQAWPHNTIKDDRPEFDLTEREANSARALNLASLECRHLCQACIAIVYDCLYRGLSPWNWQPWPTRDHKQDALDWANESRGSLQPQTRERSQSLDYVDAHRAGHLLVDATPHCELCKIKLSSQNDCGLRIAFLECECVAYSAWASGRIEYHVFRESTITDNRFLVNKVIATLPFDFPTSLYRNSIPLAAVQDNPDFRRFVWRRQKVRAVHSLITSIRKQMSCLQQLPVSGFGDEFGFWFLFREWRSFLEGFAPLLKACSFDNPCCSGCNKRSSHPCIVSVCLTCDGLPLICEKCCHSPGSPHGGASRHPCFQIGYLPKHPRIWGDHGTCGVLDAVKELIKWYVATAVFYGLEFTIPKDKVSIQQALDTIPKKCDKNIADWILDYHKRC